jgi:hypothetical protein
MPELLVTVCNQTSLHVRELAVEGKALENSEVLIGEYILAVAIILSSQ